VNGRGERVELKVPATWTVERLGDAQFRVFSKDAVEPRNTVEVVLGDGARVPFGVLGPAEARGFPIGQFVPKCPHCAARVEACICAKQTNLGQPVLHWRISGPYAANWPGLNVTTPVDAAIARRKPDSAGEWKDATADFRGVVDLDGWLGRHEQAVAYGIATIDAVEDGEAELLIGSDDGIRVWLNGAQVHEKSEQRPVVPGSDVVRVRLRRGANQLVVKLANDRSNWGWSVHVRQ